MRPPRAVTTMSEQPISAAQTLFPGLPSANAPVDRAAPDPSRSAAASIYGSAEGGIERARETIQGGVAKSASETDPNAAAAGLPSNEKGEPTIERAPLRLD